MRILCIDFETANYDPESACSIGYALVEDSGLIETGSFLIKPHPDHSEFRRDFILIHGIKPAHVKDRPEFPSVFEKMRHLFTGSTLAAHFAVFDMSVLRALMDLYDIDLPETEFVCTCKLARKLWPSLENHKLPTVSRVVKFKLNHHDAKSDAEACSAVLRRIIGETKAKTVEELSYNSGVKIGVLNREGIRYRKGKKPRTQSKKKWGEF